MNRLGAVFDEVLESKGYDFEVLATSQDYTKVRLPVTFRQPAKIYNQGRVGSCVAFSLVNGRNYTERKQEGTDREFNPAFIYANRKENHWQGEGMIPEQALDQLIKYGVVESTEWVQNNHYSILRDIFDNDRDRIINKGIDNRVTTYWSIIPKRTLSIGSTVLGYTTDEYIRMVKYALVKGYEVYISVDVYTSFYEACRQNKGVIPNRETGETNHGGHLMRLVGYDEYDRWIIANSWGENSGDNGFVYIGYLNPCIRRCYAVVDNVKGGEEEKVKYVVSIMHLNNRKQLENVLRFNKSNFDEVYGENTLGIIECHNGFYLYIRDSLSDNMQSARKHRVTDNDRATPIFPVSKFHLYYNIKLPDVVLGNLPVGTKTIKINNQEYISVYSNYDKELVEEERQRGIDKQKTESMREFFIDNFNIYEERS